ncbi:MAG: serine--tRNA ligase [Clostridia bacterium]|nr:serine--tRNA ligase [Clostridia bacterium]
MLDIRMIIEDKQKVADALSKRGYVADLDNIIVLDKTRRSIIAQVESKKAQRNKASEQIAVLKRNKQDASELIEQSTTIGVDIKQLDNHLAEVEKQLFDAVALLPNMPDDDIIAGDKEQNVVLRQIGSKPTFDFAPKNHVELCTALGMIDYERGVKLGGNGYWIYRNKGALLEWALLNFFVEQHLADGYEFILPPHMLTYKCGFGAGQFPKFTDEVYWIDGEQDRTKGQFMLPTAETSLVNMYSGETLAQKSLPIKLFAYTPCYRKEAGSYRSEERGMIRGHQFNKVEMLCFATPEQSQAIFEEMVAKAERLVTLLGLHYQVSKLAGADISASMARTYDIEVWLPSMGIYKEVSSVSNSNDYQARRNNTRYRDDATGKPRYLHTLNGSGLATSRVIPAIVEQFQNADGSVNVPQVLQKWTGCAVIK